MLMPEPPFAAIVTGGTGPEPSIFKRIVDASAIVLAADQGLELSRSLGREPDLWIGDFDSSSIQPRLANFKGPLVKLAQDKDVSDTEAALRVAMEKGYVRTVVVGGGEGRFDHSLGILSLFYGDFAPTFWVTRCETIFPLVGERVVRTNPGQGISFFPLCEARVVSEGLRWELGDLTLTPGTMSLSNRSLGVEVRLQPIFGTVLVLVNHEKGCP